MKSEDSLPHSQEPNIRHCPAWATAHSYTTYKVNTNFNKKYYKQVHTDSH
jgi:hypothetical protein